MIQKQCCEEAEIGCLMNTLFSQPLQKNKVVDLETRILAFENKCYRKKNDWHIIQKHKTNEYSWQQVDIDNS